MSRTVADAPTTVSVWEYCKNRGTVGWNGNFAKITFRLNPFKFDFATGNAVPMKNEIDINNDCMQQSSKENNERDRKILVQLPPPKKFNRNLCKVPSNMSGDACQRMKTANAETLEYTKRYRFSVGQEIAREEAARWSFENQPSHNPALNTAALFFQLQSSK